MDMRKAMTAMVGVLALAGSAQASVLLLDFGTGPVYDGTNDPAHVEGTVPADYTTWRGISDLNQQVVTDSLGNNITVNTGRNTLGTGNGIDLQRPTAPVSGTGSGIFGTALTQDSMISINDGVNSRDPIGALITGLPLGQYYVYVISHYAGDPTGSAVALAGAVNVSLNFQATNDIDDVYAIADNIPLTGTNTTSWEAGNNYARFTVTLTAGNPQLLVATDDSQAGNANSTLTAVMITPVPEPAALGLLAAAAPLALRRRRA